jgi:hypothetical protein
MTFSSGGWRLISIGLIVPLACWLSGPCVAQTRADQFPGSDWCARIQVAERSLGPSNGEVWVTRAVDGSSACEADLIVGQGHIIRFVDGGVFRLGQQSIRLAPHSGVISDGALRGVSFLYKGNGVALGPVSHSETTPNEGIILRGISVLGRDANEGSANFNPDAVGIDMFNALRWTLEDVEVADFLGSQAVGIRIFATCNCAYYNNLHHVWAHHSRAQLVMDADRDENAPNRQMISDSLFMDGLFGTEILRGGGQAFSNCKWEGLQRVSLRIKSDNNVVMGASIESHGHDSVGLEFLPGSRANVYVGSIVAARTVDDQNRGATSLDVNRVIGPWPNGSVIEVSSYLGRPSTTNVNRLFLAAGEYDIANQGTASGRIYFGPGGTGSAVALAIRKDQKTTDLWRFLDTGVLEYSNGSGGSSDGSMTIRPKLVGAAPVLAFRHAKDEIAEQPEGLQFYRCNSCAGATGELQWSLGSQPGGVGGRPKFLLQDYVIGSHARLEFDTGRDGHTILNAANDGVVILNNIGSGVKVGDGSGNWTFHSEINSAGQGRFDGGVRLSSTGAVPGCDASRQGLLWFTPGGTGLKDTLELCAKDGSGAYAWRMIY